MPRILDLYEELTEEQHQIPRDDLQRVFTEITSMSGHELLVAEEDGMVVGTMVLLVVPNLSHGSLPWAIVENMIVDGRYRRRGTGRLLMKYAISQARKAGCYKVQLLSNKKRHEAHQFYEVLGFENSAHGFRLYL